MNPFKINFLFPSATRPEKFFSTLDNLNDMCLSEDWEVITIHEESDLTMNNPQVKLRLAQYPNVKPFFINSSGKIDAINKGLDYLSKDYDIVVLVADDIEFTVKGFDLFIQSDMQQYWPKLDGLLHYPDNIKQSGERQITMPVIGRKLIEKWGYLYEPEFLSVWADNEQMEVSKRTGTYKYIKNQFYKHNHPIWTKEPYDELYAKNEALYNIDKETYFKHLSNNFGL